LVCSISGNHLWQVKVMKNKPWLYGISLRSGIA
jgi:hypothetical protein